MPTHRSRRRLRQASLVAAVSLAFPLLSITAAHADPGDVGYEGPSYARANGDPTGSKPESKLWFNDGSWWSVLWNGTTYDIYKLDSSDQSWDDTGVAVENRTIRSDTLWDGQHLYVATHRFTDNATSGRTAASRLFRYSYDAATHTYSLDSGYPATINSRITETLVIDKDGTGRLWATWVRQDTDGAYKVWVNHTTTNDATWSAPIVLPVGTTATVTSDDISSVIAMNGKVGVMWSTEVGATQKMLFSTHTDGAADTVWSAPETALAQGDDHINLKTMQDAADGRVFAVVKTSLTGANPLVELLVRDAAGAWTSHVVANASTGWTRPILALDEGRGELQVIATAPDSGGTIYRKVTPMDDIAFDPTSIGEVFMKDASSNHLNNATTTKQPVSSATGLVVMASNQSTQRYWHAFDPLTPDGPGPDTTAPSVPSGVTATAASSSQIDVTWTASTDEVGVTGYTVSRDGTAAATVTGTSWSDTGLAAGSSHTYTVDAVDAAGNRSAASAPATATTPAATGGGTGGGGTGGGGT
ncbi:MAG: hypothetical protein JWN29_1618, partial [Acidimicrobiales bacterium]|nr:hypothetical protein [Acidimicrobiales bacterium]